MALIKARYTGDKKITYRWLGVVGSGNVCHAQTFPSAAVEGIDTWSPDDVDARIPRKTVVRVPAGLVVLDSERSGRGAHEYTAGVTSDDPKAPIDWAAARYVETKMRDDKHGKPTIRVHVIAVNGVRGEYVEAAS